MTQPMPAGNVVEQFHQTVQELCWCRVFLALFFLYGEEEPVHAAA